MTRRKSRYSDFLLVKGFNEGCGRPDVINPVSFSHVMCRRTRSFKIICFIYTNHIDHVCAWCDSSPLDVLSLKIFLGILQI